MDEITVEENYIIMSFPDTDMEIDKENDLYIEDEEGGIRVDDDIYIPPPLKENNKVDINGPRLMITKIVNQNFKSYGGVQVIGPFHQVKIK